MKEQYLILDSKLNNVIHEEYLSTEELMNKYSIKDKDEILRLYRLGCLFRWDLEICIIYPKSEDLYNGWAYVDDEYRLRNVIRNYNISKL